MFVKRLWAIRLFNRMIHQVNRDIPRLAIDVDELVEHLRYLYSEGMVDYEYLVEAEALLFLTYRASWPRNGWITIPIRKTMDEKFLERLLFIIREMKGLNLIHHKHLTMRTQRMRFAVVNKARFKTHLLKQLDRYAEPIRFVKPRQITQKAFEAVLG